MNKLDWSFYQLWNEGILETREERKVKPRERLWASDLGKSYIDVYLALKGEKPSNDFTMTALRKFEAGNIWERILEVVLIKAGVLIESQEYVEYKMKKCLPVTGRLDFLAGGKIDKEKALKSLEEFSWLPENILSAAKKIIDGLAGKELKEIVLEIKSVSSFMFDKYEISGMANPNHRLQLMHYLLGKSLNEGHVVYICKDDARLLEVGVFNPSLVNEDYENYVKTISEYYFADEQPPKEKEIVFDEEWGKFTVNWKVIYSPYLTKVYGYKDRQEVENIFRPLAERWNRVLGRVKDGKDMTKNNLEAIKEIKKFGYDWEEILAKLKYNEEKENKVKKAEEEKEVIGG